MSSFLKCVPWCMSYVHIFTYYIFSIQASCVTVNSCGVVGLADFSIEKRLADLYKESHIEQPGVTFVDDTIPSKNSKKGDILNFVSEIHCMLFFDK